MGGGGLTTASAVDDLLAALDQRGVRLTLRRHRIAASPAGAVREDERAMIVEHRRAVRLALAAADPDVAWRVEAMRPQVPAFPGIIPILRVRTETAPGTCLSCGDPADDARCDPCIAAMHVVLDGWAGWFGLRHGLRLLRSGAMAQLPGDDSPSERIASCAMWEFCLLPVLLLMAAAVIWLLTHR